MPAHPRVAVIGAGPSGLYAAAALAASEVPVDVDVLDRLPAPYGLVRYGVAPDHVKMKSVIRVLQKPFADGSRVRFLGNVRVGEGGIPLDVLREHYHAIVHASGSSVDRRLGIPGEDLLGSHGSGAFVSWYCGHPDFVDLQPELDHPGVVVVGAGNVALDVARVLARGHVEMAGTDIPDPVLEALRGSGVEDVHVVVRRGPEHVKFTPAELRQIGELSGVQVLVHDDGVLAAGVEEPEERRQRQNITMLTAWAADPGQAAPRRIHLHFHRTPVRLLEEAGRVTGMVVERTGGGPQETLDAGLVVRAIGYAGEPIPGLPYDERAGIVPNEGGRVAPGSYVTGWIKRGPTGVIGTNKGDAVETVAALLDDLHTLPEPPHPSSEAVDQRLEAYGLDPVTWADWERLDAEEVRLGEARGGAERVKVAELQAMLAAARGRTRV
ncbi:FAD-dependent oxidoreductase [Pseudonocardia pini]|uniref:FAD-dependent oxidoreductase n=1 Tax=Pseudonocardia pini TaxID=2758030 RepID=UPI0015F06A7B|nr:FAD-dependent oxidoreductase [Pseudonocardia pini]